ncbi:hypothetical protein LXL04_017775 [Taraxacum kok-saghyz]
MIPSLIVNRDTSRVPPPRGFLVESVSQGDSSWLVDDMDELETRDDTGVLVLVNDQRDPTILIDRKLTINRISGIHGHLVLGGITYQPSGISKSNSRRSRHVALIIGNDLDMVMLPHTNTRVRSSKINSNRHTFMLRHQSPPQSKTSTVSAPNDALYVSITLLPALKVASDATVVIGIASISRAMRDNIRHFNEFDRHHCKASNGPSSQM